MDEWIVQSHLSRIETEWSVVEAAHGEDDEAARAALAALARRYSRAVYRYLLASLRNVDAADEVFQEFGLRLARGGLRRADPDRGRFRDYLKTTVVNLVVDHRRKRGRQAARPSEDVQDLPQPEAESFDESCRTELLEAAWSALDEYERSTKRPYATVLRCRAEHGEATSAELAELLASRVPLARPPSPAAVRKMLQRSRRQFAEFLFNEVERLLDDADPTAVETELADLGLLEYCRSAIARRRDESS